MPDPYAANLGYLKAQFVNPYAKYNNNASLVWVWLVAHVKWHKKTNDSDAVGVSFLFAPLPQPQTIIKAPKTKKQAEAPQTTPFIPNKKISIPVKTTDSFKSIGKIFTKSKIITNDPETGTAKNTVDGSRGAFISNTAFSLEATRQTYVPRDPLNFESFSLLDVSSKANQMGVAYTGGNENNFNLLRLYNIDSRDGQNSGTMLPIQVEGLNVVTPGRNARAFTVPQIAWEPLLNLTPPAWPKPKYPGHTEDPPAGWNYYPDDGFATRIGNLSAENVALSPIPMAKYLEQMYEAGKDGKTYAIFNLPFGMLAVTLLDNNSAQNTKPQIKNVKPLFEKYIHGGLQLELTAGSSLKPEDNLFQGYTFQLVNVQDMYGKLTNASTLGASVENIFNGEFGKPPANPEDKSRPGVPLKRIGLSGYGASAFSDWHNKNAAFAETSQATFNVATGRTAHEVVQVKSVIYPWGIFVVRTITIFRLSNGFLGRIDSGWQAEGDGKFYFGVKGDNNPYEIHKGVVQGLYNIRNIRENDLSHTEPIKINPGDIIFNSVTNKEETFIGTAYTDTATLQGLTFDADIEIENVVEGAGANNRVPSKGVLGFVQLQPRGTPITKEIFRSLLMSQNNSIGGQINCTLQIAGTLQFMKVNRVDVNNSTDSSNSPIFVAAARGSVVLPKEGSWSMVTHSAADGTVTPLPESMSVPLIRIGKPAKDELANAADAANLVRIANPTELLKLPDATTINFGFLQNLSTQKVLFLTPVYKIGFDSLLSKTPPLLADAYRLLNTKGIFPNIGTAVSDLGTAIPLITGTDDLGNALNAFEQVKDGAANVLDAGKQVFEILSIVKPKIQADKLVDQGFKLIKQKGNDVLDKVFKFDLPSIEYELVKTKGLRIYVEYAANSKKTYKGKFDYDVDFLAKKLTDQWKARMNNMAMVVDLGPFERLMTINGNFNSKKGQESNYGGDETMVGDTQNDSILPSPEIKFSDALEPVIKILEILSALSQGDYKDAFQKGLKVAMSNNANIWEYKYEASKDIPLVRFPLGALYESPQTPLKLEASMGLGFYFNAALKVTTDPKQLLPTAGAFFKFHGGLQVMCVSVGVGTIYAVGNVDLKIAADTSPLISVAMKFGFGAQIGVGLPVIGNVSILFMVGVEIYVDSSEKVIVTAILLFRGHAEILGGIVGVTITIEAKGAIIKEGPGKPTNCQASVSFGLDISIFLVIDISFHESWQETRQIA
ncbi:MAG: hypothetical protein JKY70_21695 [Mucilaginibacter sp.]|nr:hypothetical protein [Mucilaginibacter sp.]